MKNRGLKRLIGYCRNIDDHGNSKSYIHEMEQYNKSVQLRVVSGKSTDKGQILEWIRDDKDP